MYDDVNILTLEDFRWILKDYVAYEILCHTVFSSLRSLCQTVTFADITKWLLNIWSVVKFGNSWVSIWTIYYIIAKYQRLWYIDLRDFLTSVWDLNKKCTHAQNDDKSMYNYYYRKENNFFCGYDQTNSWHTFMCCGQNW